MNVLRLPIYISILYFTTSIKPYELHISFRFNSRHFMYFIIYTNLLFIASCDIVKNIYLGSAPGS